MQARNYRNTVWRRMDSEEDEEKMRQEDDKIIRIIPQPNSKCE